MKPTVYLETSIIGYLASRMSRELLTAAHQQLTQKWWIMRRPTYEVFVSGFVVKECSAGDSSAALERMTILKGIAELDVNSEVGELADLLLKELRLPARAAADASRIAVAAYHGMDYLLTWNCTHIANAMLWDTIDQVCRLYNCEPPIICTPEELMGDDE